MQAKENIIKVIFLGSAGSGKSSLIRSFAKEKFQKKYESTLGVEVSVHPVAVGQKKYDLKIWDTQGPSKNDEEDFGRTLCKSNNLAILVFDLTNRESFERLQDLLAIFKKHSPDASIRLVATKRDLEEQRVVSYDEVQTFAMKNNIATFMETSAKTGENIELMFQRLTDPNPITPNKPSDTTKVVTTLTQSSDKTKLLQRLKDYIDRIESYITKSLIREINFAHGFCFFARSRAVNRKANYFLAKLLYGRLDHGDTIGAAFSDIEKDRRDIIIEHALHSDPNYTARGIHSSELNSIIRDAHIMDPVKPSERSQLMYDEL